MFKAVLGLVICCFTIFIFAPTVSANAMWEFEEDVIPTSGGDLKITFVGHGSLILNYGGKVIHVDPYSKLADYGVLPKADAVLITHQHQDHLDLNALKPIFKDNTEIILNAKSAEIVGKGTVLKNGETTNFLGIISVEATPAYNLVHKRDTGVPFHPKGEGNGYILTFGDKRVYIAGDTEDFPEMEQIKNIDVAFLPMNLPYTMTPEMVKNAALVIQPKILYPYHFGDTDTNKFLDLMVGVKNIEVRIRNMQ